MSVGWLAAWPARGSRLRSVISEFYHQAFCKLFCSRSDDLKVMDCGPGRLQGELPLIWKRQFLLSLTDTWKSAAVFDTNSCSCTVNVVGMETV